jgi:ATP synthase mitochondrial F1 complex assembly factor 2
MNSATKTIHRAMHAVRKSHRTNSTSILSTITRNFSTKKSTTTRDTRLAGRPRFYKQVDITPLDAAPWETISSVIGNRRSGQSTSNDKDATATAQDTVASPISAGVDGTQSATGVRHIPENAVNGSSSQMSNFQWMLTPRRPGESVVSSISSSNDISWYGVTLDGKTLSTPMGQKLALPSQSLAYMIAAEWDAQTTRLQPTNMPFMTLACTVLDQAALHPHVYREEALKFLPTDTTCFWADPMEDRVLHRRQEQAWTGIHQYCHHRLGAKPTTAMGIEGILMSRQRGSVKPFAGLPHPVELTEAARNWTESLDAWQLVALSSINSQAKSFLVGFSLLDSQKGNGTDQKKLPSIATSVEKAIEASRVEEEFQITNWGLVEGGHDYDRVNCSIQLFSASLFAKTILMDNSI